MNQLDGIRDAVIEGRRNEIAGMVQSALDQGADPQTIIHDHMIAGMIEVGARFEAKRVFLPEMMIAARTMQAGLELLGPIIQARGRQSAKLGRVVMGTVFGDVHDIGKNLVVLMLETEGFEVLNLGENLTPEDFVRAAHDFGAQVVGLSSLLTTGGPQLKATTAALRQSGLPLKIICGGAAVNREFALTECGMDGYARHALGAVRLCQQLLEQN